MVNHKDGHEYFEYQLKDDMVFVITKKNKGTVVGVYTDSNNAEKDKEELGGERYFRISKYFINKMIYK